MCLDPLLRFASLWFSLSNYLTLSVVLDFGCLLGICESIPMRPYAASFFLYLGILSYFLNKMMVVPFTLLSTPCDRRPNLLGIAFIQVLVCLGHFIKC